MISIRVTPRKLMGGTGFLVESEVSYTNTTREAVVFSASNLRFTCRDRGGVHLPTELEPVGADASLLNPGEDRVASISFRCPRDSLHEIEVSFNGERALATI